MGVMKCDRKDCESILCRDYISDVGYVCPDCKSDFKDSLTEERILELTEEIMLEKLKSFMKTVKKKDDTTLYTVEDFFEKYSPEQ